MAKELPRLSNLLLAESLEAEAAANRESNQSHLDGL